jgi:membrane protein YqaA with SNARE-associated domain
MKTLPKLFGKIWDSILYYKRKGYFNFIGGNILRIVFFYLLVILGFVLIGKFLLDLDLIFHKIIDRFTDAEVLTIFFVSESFLGPFPPDLFMLWTAKFNQPLIMLSILGVLSYLGGIISYQLGLWISKRKKIKNFIERRLKKYIGLTQKWGGAFITIAALFPFTPYATVVLAVSLLKYPFKRFLLFGLFRVVRFIVQGIFLINFIELSI